MDDVYGCGPPEKVKEIMADVVSEVIMKWEVREPGSTFSHLKKVRTLSTDGKMFIQPDPKHIDTAIKLLGLESSKPAPTPGVSGGSKTLEGAALDESDAKVYRSYTGLLMYVAPERPDAQYCIRELTKALREPTSKDMQAVRPRALELRSEGGAAVPRRRSIPTRIGHRTSARGRAQRAGPSSSEATCCTATAEVLVDVGHGGSRRERCTVMSPQDAGDA